MCVSSTWSDGHVPARRAMAFSMRWRRSSKPWAATPQFEAELDLSLFRPAFEISEQDALPQSLKEAVERTRGPCSLVRVTGWTDSALLAEAGIPTVVFGPGGAGLHGLEECGDTEQICCCRDILVDFAQSWYIYLNTTRGRGQEARTTGTTQNLAKAPQTGTASLNRMPMPYTRIG